MTANGVNQAPGLNAISVDGMCGGVLDSNVQWNWQPDKSPQLVVASTGNASSVTFVTNQISQIPTPEECTRPDNASDMWQPCHNFAFSPDGHWLTYNWGDDYCGQNLNLVDLATMEKRTIGGSTWLIQFLSSGKMLIGQSACERGWLRVYDPETGALENLGDAGEMHWNSTKTTFIVETSAYVGVARGLWGYNLQTESFLLLPTAGYVIKVSPCGHLMEAMLFLNIVMCLGEQMNLLLALVQTRYGLLTCTVGKVRCLYQIRNIIFFFVNHHRFKHVSGMVIG
jgi:hypothetical protein